MMKGQILKQVFLLFLLALVFHSCMTDEALLPAKDKSSPEVAEAQIWYNSQDKKEGIPLMISGTKKRSPLKPNWRMTSYHENEEYKVTEVLIENTTRIKHPDFEKNGLEYVERFITSCPECMAKFHETQDDRYAASKVRLIIRTCKENKEKDGFVMIAYPDFDYLEAHLDNPFQRINYLERDETFCGIIHFYNLDGEYVNGWKYIDGKAYELQWTDKNREG